MAHFDEHQPEDQRGAAIAAIVISASPPHPVVVPKPQPGIAGAEYASDSRLP